MAVDRMPEAARPKRTKRTSLILDLDLLDQAREQLGTKTTTETIHRALDEAMRLAARRSLAAWDFDLTLEELEEMRRPRTFDFHESS